MFSHIEFAFGREKHKKKILSIGSAYVKAAYHGSSTEQNHQIKLTLLTMPKITFVKSNAIKV